MKLTEEIIDGLIECVLRSDWNGCAGNKIELYTIWNNIAKNHIQLKQQILDNQEKLEKIKELIGTAGFVDDVDFTPLILRLKEILEK